jgi:hypothetical protein
MTSSTTTRRRPRLAVVVAWCVVGLGIGLIGARIIGSDVGVSPEAVRLESSADVVVVSSLPSHEEPEPVEEVLEVVDPAVRLEIQSDDHVTVGIARAGDVDAWLAGTSHDRATWIDEGGRMATQPRDGDAGIPTGTPDWLALASGTDLEVSWSPRAGEAVAGVMDAGADPGIDVTLEVGFSRRLLLLLGLVVGIGVIAITVDLVTSIRMWEDDTGDGATADTGAVAG